MKRSFRFALFCFVMTSSIITHLQINADYHFDFNFTDSHQGWIGDFADYPIGEEEFYELSWGWTNLPLPLEENKKGMVLSGNNHSDDLMMFIKKRITGLQPNSEYELNFAVTIETNIPIQQFGVGGSPGESVFFKVGASPHEPLKIVERKFYRLNIDVGCQGNSGVNGIIIGNLANSAVDQEAPTFKPKLLYTAKGLKASTNQKGHLWLFVGTDSAFEGFSKYYIANVTINAQSVN